MGTFKIEGGHRLKGSIQPQGAKNEALQILCAVLLTPEKVTINNIPDIIDVNKLIALLVKLGVKVEKLVEDVYTLRFDYAHMSKVMNAVSKPPFQVIEQRFTITAELDVSVRQSLAEEALKQLKAQVAEVYLEEVDGLEEIEGFDLEHAYTR